VGQRATGWQLIGSLIVTGVILAAAFALALLSWLETGLLLIGSLIVTGVILAAAFAPVLISLLKQARRWSMRRPGLTRGGRDSHGGTRATSEPGMIAPSPRPRAATTKSDWTPLPASGGQDSQAPGGNGTEVGGSGVPGELLVVSLSATGLGNSLHATSDDYFTLVRVQIRQSDNADLPPGTDSESNSPACMAIRSDAVEDVPRSVLKKLCATGRDKGKETISDYIAQRILSPGVEERLTRAWRTHDPGHIAAVGEHIDKFGEGVHEFAVGQPAQSLAAFFGVPGSSTIADLSATVPINSLDKPVNAAVWGIDIIGIVGGAASGNPVLTLASFKALVHREMYKKLVEGIERALFDGPPLPSAAPDPTPQVEELRTESATRETENERAQRRGGGPPWELPQDVPSRGSLSKEEQAAVRANLAEIRQRERPPTPRRDREGPTSMPGPSE
jgi:hypothetical protein